jgi:hypothetical protein
VALVRIIWAVLNAIRKIAVAKPATRAQLLLVIYPHVRTKYTKPRVNNTSPETSALAAVGTSKVEYLVKAARVALVASMRRNNNSIPPKRLQIAANHVIAPTISKAGRLL